LEENCASEIQARLERLHEFNKKALVFISSDLYPRGEFMPLEEVRLSIWDLGFRHGFAVYDAGRTIRGKPWQLKEHMNRFFRSCRFCRLNLGKSPEEMERIVVEACSRNQSLVKENDGEDQSFGMEATPGEYGTYGLPLPAPGGKGKPTIIIRTGLLDMKVIARSYKTGISLVTPSTRHVPPMVIDPKIKTHSRHFQAFGLYEAQLVDSEAQPLFLDIFGNLTETHIANVFLVYDGVLMTPTTRNILEGLSRSNVINLARQLGISLIERDLQPYHLCNADEAFISGSSRFITSVGKYNGIHIGRQVPGPITKKLLEAFSKLTHYDITGISFLSPEEKAELDV